MAQNPVKGTSSPKGSGSPRASSSASALEDIDSAALAGIRVATPAWKLGILQKKSIVPVVVDPKNDPKLAHLPTWKRDLVLKKEQEESQKEKAAAAVTPIKVKFSYRLINPFKICYFL